LHARPSAQQLRPDNVKGFVVDPALQVIEDGLDQRVARLPFRLGAPLATHQSRSGCRLTTRVRCLIISATASTQGFLSDGNLILQAFLRLYQDTVCTTTA
jgi:hypothetical protein